MTALHLIQGTEMYWVEQQGDNLRNAHLANQQEAKQGEHLSDAFAQVNPMKKVPAMKDNDFTLSESVAILLYLTHKYKVPDHWYPQELQARARVDEYLAWQHTALRRSCLRALWHKFH
ncbi:glutathione S-transferase theta-1-like protein [Cricetulus griseus]|nr:glutathione S-transferase theta-1-like protein [Cricetulus griseus]